MIIRRIQVLLFPLLAAGCAQILGLSDPTLGDTGADAAPPADARVVPDATPPITLTVTVDGRGHVTSNPTGINCPGTCMASFKAGSNVRITATASGGASFTGFTPDCGAEVTCLVPTTADVSYTAKFKDNSGGHSVVFVTTEMYDPSTLSPLSVADKNCNDSAKAAELPGTYVAFISSTGVNAKDRIPSSARGWVRTDGQPFLDRVADIPMNKIYFPPDLDGAGAPVVGVFPATGTDGTGSATDKTCKGWTSSSAQDRWIGGDPTSGSFTWMQGFETDCTQMVRLYCFGTGSNTPLTITKTPGRVAFVTQMGLPIPLGGVDKADAICKSEATGAGLPGTYKALISMNGVAAASRFNAAGMPWVRVDGIPLAFPGSSILDGGSLQVPLGQQASGTYVGVYRVAGGSATPQDPGTPDTTCNDWTVTDNSRQYWTAHAHQTRNWWGSFLASCTDFCPNCLPIICLQE
jgi:List-Bact-rpt repeat protein